MLLCITTTLCREEISEKYGGKLSQFMEGPLYEVFSKIMRVIVGRKITVPGKFKRCKKLTTFIFAINFLSLISARTTMLLRALVALPLGFFILSIKGSSLFTNQPYTYGLKKSLL